jgi:Pyruvate dehydrogenase complex, dehydrogenase (E1) component
VMIKYQGVFMSDEAIVKKNVVMENIELSEWLASLDYVLNSGSPERVQYLLQQLQIRAQESGVTLPLPIIHLISIPSPKKTSQFPWKPWFRAPDQIFCALECYGYGGQCKQSRWWHWWSHLHLRLICYPLWGWFQPLLPRPLRSQQWWSGLFQGHASPGIYARAYIEGRLTEINLTNFRRELAQGGGFIFLSTPLVNA